MKIYFAVAYDTEDQSLSIDMDTDVGGCRGDAARAYDPDTDDGNWEVPAPQDWDAAFSALSDALISEPAPNQ